jgi:hypothetical protein
VLDVQRAGVGARGERPHRRTRHEQRPLRRDRGALRRPLVTQQQPHPPDPIQPTTTAAAAAAAAASESTDPHAAPSEPRAAVPTKQARKWWPVPSLGIHRGEPTSDDTPNARPAAAACPGTDILPLALEPEGVRHSEAGAPAREAEGVVGVRRAEGAQRREAGEGGQGARQVLGGRDAQHRREVHPARTHARAHDAHYPPPPHSQHRGSRASPCGAEQGAVGTERERWGAGTRREERGEREKRHSQNRLKLEVPLRGRNARHIPPILAATDSAEVVGRRRRRVHVAGDDGYDGARLAAVGTRRYHQRIAVQPDVALVVLLAEGLGRVKVGTNNCNQGCPSGGVGKGGLVLCRYVPPRLQPDSGPQLAEMVHAPSDGAPRRPKDPHAAA